MHKAYSNQRHLSPSSLKRSKDQHALKHFFQIVNWAGGKEEHQLFLPELLNLLSSIGTRPVTIISVNGNLSSSNSILTNWLIKYLKHGCRTYSTGVENGFSSNHITGSQIRIWTEPLYIRNNGKEIGVIVMEQSGTNPFLTALSLLVSSVSVFLQSNSGTEEVIQWFSNFLIANDPKAYPKRIYQTLSILCNNGKKEFQQNYENDIRQLKDKFFSESSKKLPTAMEKYFNEVNFGVVGFPDEKLSACPTSVLKYLEKQFSPENLENSVKQVCGKQQSGNSLKDFICLWAQIVKTSMGKLLKPKNIQFETEKMFASNLTLELLKTYRKVMQEVLDSNPSLNDEKFEAFHSESEAELLDELMNMTVSKSIKDDCRKTFMMNADALKYRFMKEVHNRGSLRHPNLTTLKDVHIKYDEKEVLGRGSSGTVVYKGTFGERPVAVKRLNRVDFDIEEEEDKEVATLIKCDSHKNVIKFFHVEKRKNHYLIALELCNCTLDEWLKREGRGLDLDTELDANDILRQTTEGLAHLHRHDVIHRDVKPQNILLLHDFSTKKVCVKISDFGISKNLAENRSSATITSGSGTEGWMAPEILQYKVNASPNRKPTMTRASDIFALGCVYYYVLTEGNHPFGDYIRRQVNILDDKPDIRENDMEEHNKGGSTLIKKMIARDPEERPKMPCILSHPLLWNNKRTLEFLADVSNCAKENESAELVKKAIEELEDGLKEHVGILETSPHGWVSRMTPNMIKYLTGTGETRHKGQIKYNGKHVKQIIRAIRNMRNHFGDLPVEAQNEIGKPDDFIRYWIEKFPYLVSSTWTAFERVAQEPKFGLQDYYHFD
ncbi:Serine/threonine-protein kinase/endoribonuclease IRE1 [Orchesella cincta]|uniref:non-specific serine/threonine protein kinase n=1 Tax=Orchesella cincta TaxID=48709 RepID=A0A1D2MSP8_ORCCI|nr:Serine/threonine-protein kinase/endoribonuclease IRE1 [Orchesella cincta]